MREPGRCLTRNRTCPGSPRSAFSCVCAGAAGTAARAVVTGDAEGPSEGGHALPAVRKVRQPIPALAAAPVLDGASVAPAGLPARVGALRWGIGVVPRRLRDILDA